MELLFHQVNTVRIQLFGTILATRTPDPGLWKRYLSQMVVVTNNYPYVRLEKSLISTYDFKVAGEALGSDIPNLSSNVKSSSQFGYSKDSL